MEDKINLKLMRVWWRVTGMGIQSELLTSIGGFIFLFGKILRFILFFVFLQSVVFSLQGFSGYTPSQIILFFLTFNLVDIFVQFLFRGVYRFRPAVVSGNYDLDLLKPLPAFFKPLFGGADSMDGVTLIMLMGYLFYFFLIGSLEFSFFSFLTFLLFFANSLFLAFAFHLTVCAICILTTEIDHLIWIYRDLTNMARFPTDIYSQGVRAILTFVMPVVILITVPAKALMGILSWQGMILALAITIVFLYGSLKFWKYALRQYTSASS